MTEDNAGRLGLDVTETIQQEQNQGMDRGRSQDDRNPDSNLGFAPAGSEASVVDGQNDESLDDNLPPSDGSQVEDVDISTAIEDIGQDAGDLIDPAPDQNEMSDEDSVDSDLDTDEAKTQI